MPQVTVVIPEDLDDALKLMIQETGRSQSSLCSAWIREGLYREVENLNKLEVYMSLITKRKTRAEKAEEE